MFLIVVLFVLFLISAIITAFLPRVAPSDDTLRYGRVVTACLAGIFLLVFILSSIVTVSTKNVGVETAFGSTTGHLSNGIHLKWPWEGVTEMDAAIQTDSYDGSNCVNVRIANQQTACVNVTIRWRIEPNDVDSLFQNYRTFDNVRDSLVTRELYAALNYQLATYNPLNSIVVSLPTGANYPPAPTLSEVATAVTKTLRSEVNPEGIHVLQTIIPIMTFDPQTQSRLNQVQTQEALTRVATAQEQTNAAQSAANNALATSVNSSPNVLVSKCLDIIELSVKNGNKIPSGFSCWPASGADGVIVNSGQ